MLQAYVFILRFKFATVDDRDAWFKKFKILAEYVAENEPSTLAYDACVAEDDPLEVIAFERYQCIPLLYNTSNCVSSEPLFLLHCNVNGCCNKQIKTMCSCAMLDLTTSCMLQVCGQGCSEGSP